MNYFSRIFFSGILGFAIVLTLFLLMFKLLSNDSPNLEPSNTSVELITYIPPSDHSKKLKAEKAAPKTSETTST